MELQVILPFVCLCGKEGLWNYQQFEAATDLCGGSCGTNSNSALCCGGVVELPTIDSCRLSMWDCGTTNRLVLLLTSVEGYVELPVIVPQIG